MQRIRPQAVCTGVPGVPGVSGVPGVPGCWASWARGCPTHRSGLHITRLLTMEPAAFRHPCHSPPARALCSTLVVIVVSIFTYCVRSIPCSALPAPNLGLGHGRARSRARGAIPLGLSSPPKSRIARSAGMRIQYPAHPFLPIRNRGPRQGTVSVSCGPYARTRCRVYFGLVALRIVVVCTYFPNVSSRLTRADPC